MDQSIERTLVGSDSIPQSKIYGTILGYPQTRFAWFVIAVNFFLIGLATFAPHFSDSAIVNAWFARGPSWTVEGANVLEKQAVFTSACWLLAANLISFLSLFLLNGKAGNLKGTLSGYAEDLGPVELFDRALWWVFALTRVMFVLLVLVIASLIYWGMEKSWLERVSIFTGLFYLLYMLLNDGVAAKAFVHCSRIEPVDRKKVSEELEVQFKDYKKKLLETTKDLSVYSKLVVFVDLPILCALVPIYIQKFYILNHGPYKEGFVMGTIAMHVIAANLIAMAIDLVQYREVR
jgi:hypothetical protein